MMMVTNLTIGWKWGEIITNYLFYDVSFPNYKKKYKLDTPTATGISPNSHMKSVPQEEPEADRRTPDLL